MTTDEIIELAEQAGGEWSDFGRMQFEKEDDLARFVDLVIEKQKSSCTTCKLVEQMNV